MCNFIDAKGECWYVRWKHEHIQSAISGKPTTRTTCYLEKGRNKEMDEEQRRETGVLFSSSIVRSVKDPHNKDLARKVSFARVLRHRFPGNENKSIRETAWRGYFSRGEQNVLNADFAPQPTSEEKILN